MTLLAVGIGWWDNEGDAGVLQQEQLGHEGRGSLCVCIGIEWNRPPGHQVQFPAFTGNHLSKSLALG